MLPFFKRFQKTSHSDSNIKALVKDVISNFDEEEHREFMELLEENQLSSTLDEFMSNENRAPQNFDDSFTSSVSFNDSINMRFVLVTKPVIL